LIRAAILPALVGLLTVMQAIYLVYAIRKADTEIFVHRADGSIASLLAHNEYEEFNRGYRLYRIFRDYCMGCTVEVSGSEAFSVGLLAEVGRVRIVKGEGRPCPATVGDAIGHRNVKRFDVVTAHVPFAMFKSNDIDAPGRTVTVILDPAVGTYRTCHTEAGDLILPNERAGS